MINHNENEKRSHRYDIVNLGLEMETNIVNKKISQHDNAFT